MRYVIEKLTPRYVSEAAKLSERVFRGLRGECRRDELPDEAISELIRHHDKLYYSTILTNPLGFAFIALHKKSVVGLAIGRLCGGGGVAHLQWICVDPSHRGRGLGSSLLNTVTDYAAKMGCHKLVLYTMPCLRAALLMYLSEGFRVEGYLSRHWWGSDFLLLSKILR